MTISLVSEQEILATLIDKTRFLSKYYIDKLSGTDLHQVFKVGDVSLNSAFWLIAHMAVTQNGLLLRCTGAPGLKISWAKQFNMGGTVVPSHESPDTGEVMQVFDEVHHLALAQVRQLTPEQLDADNPFGFEILGEKTVRGIIHHYIRHENSHAGQLGWLCKLNGFKTF